MSQELGCLSLGDEPPRTTARFRIHPAVNTRDVLAGDGADGFDAAKLGDDRSGGVEVRLAHDADSCAYRYKSSSPSSELRNINCCGNRKNAHMTDQNQLREWVAAKLTAGGRGTASALASFTGLSKFAISRISAIKPGQETRDIKAHELAKIVEFFGENPDGSPISKRDTSSDASAIHTGLVTGAIVGPVRAGSWREVDDLDQRERPTVVLPADPDFPNARVLVFEVEGDSMNDLSPVPLRPGAHVVCLAYPDIARYYPPRDGMVVVVERRRDGGHLREWSVKQVELHEDRVEFHPRSTNPDHKPIVVAMDAFADDGVEIEIIGLVREVLFRLRT